MSYKLLVIFCFAFLVFANKANAQNPSLERGKNVYTIFCQSCHGENGEGMPGAFPPLAKTNRLKDTKRLVDIIKKGMTGEITVLGNKYNAEMSAVDLSDQEVADVVHYIRKSWGNKY